MDKAEIEMLMDRAIDKNKTILTLKTDVQVLKDDVHVLKTDVQDLKGDVQTIKTDLEAIKTDVRGVKGSIHDLRGEVLGIKDQIHQSAILHEEMRSEIRQILEVVISWNDKWDRYIPRHEKLLENHDVRLDVVERTVRGHLSDPASHPPRG